MNVFTVLSHAEKLRNRLAAAAGKSRGKILAAALSAAVLSSASFPASAASPMIAAPGSSVRIAGTLAAQVPSVLHLSMEETGLESDAGDGALLGTYQVVRCTDEGETAVLQALRRMSSRIRRRMEDEAESGAGDFSSTLLVRRADTNALSFLETCALKDGNGEAAVRYYGHTYDPAAGSEYALEDVVGDTRVLAQEIVEAMEKAYLQGGDAGDIVPSVRRLILRGELAWTVDYDGVSFWIPSELFGLEEQAAGPLLHIKLSYHEDDGMIAEKFKRLPSSYIAALSPDERFTMTDEADATHSLSLQEWKSASTKQRIMTVGLDNRTAIADLTSWSYRPYVMHDGGKNYLYLDTAEEGDLHLLQVYDLNVSSLDAPETLLCGLADGAELPTDPGRFLLEKNCDLLGSYRIFRNYRAGEAGPDPVDSAFRIDGDPVRVTLRRDIPAEELVSKGAERTLRTVPLPAGTELVLRSTDGESTVDLFDEQTGRTYRFTVEAGVPQTIRGVAVTELFEIR